MTNSNIQIALRECTRSGGMPGRTSSERQGIYFFNKPAFRISYVLGVTLLRVISIYM